MTSKSNKTSRRSFLGAVAGGVGATVALKGLAHAADSKKPPIGLQLWSLRDQFQKDLPGTLKQVKAWGIDEVESAGYYGRTVQEFAAALRSAGLRCRAMHRGFDELTQDFAGCLKDAEVIGAQTIVNPYLPHDRDQRYASREEIERAAAAFAKWGAEAKAAGRRFAYHTHGQEFGPAPEGTLFDVLARESGPDVGFEFDVFWITWGGADPIALMKSLPGRVWFTHLKDMAKGADPDTRPGADENVVLGTGKIDVAGIVAAGPAAGVEVNYIEDESRDPMGHIPQSVAWYRNLKI
jgi:sugar phosphate isomerase/epimerase